MEQSTILAFTTVAIIRSGGTSIIFVAQSSWATTCTLYRPLESLLRTSRQWNNPPASNWLTQILTNRTTHMMNPLRPTPRKANPPPPVMAAKANQQNPPNLLAAVPIKRDAIHLNG